MALSAEAVGRSLNDAMAKEVLRCSRHGLEEKSPSLRIASVTLMHALVRASPTPFIGHTIESILNYTLRGLEGSTTELRRTVGRLVGGIVANTAQIVDEDAAPAAGIDANEDAKAKKAPKKKDGVSSVDAVFGYLAGGFAKAGTYAPFWLLTAFLTG